MIVLATEPTSWKNGGALLLSLSGLQRRESHDLNLCKMPKSQGIRDGAIKTNVLAIPQANILAEYYVTKPGSPILHDRCSHSDRRLMHSYIDRSLLVVLPALPPAPASSQ